MVGSTTKVEYDSKYLLRFGIGVVLTAASGNQEKALTMSPVMVITLMEQNQNLIRWMSALYLRFTTLI